MRALILSSFFGLLLTALPASAAQDGCRTAIAVRDLGRSPQAATVEAFYAEWGTGCAWSVESADALQAAIEAAPEHGLDPELFDLAAIKSRRSHDGETVRAELDVRLTAAALKYATVMTFGIGDTAAGEAADDRRGLQDKLVRELDSALDKQTVGDWLKKLPPQTEGYERLKYALGVYRTIDAAGGWEQLRTHATKKSRRKIVSEPQLVRRLVIEGYLTDDTGDAQDESLTIEGLKHFQTHHGLAATGKLDESTLDALNVSAHDRVLEIAANLERWRAFARLPAATRVEVNAAAATATLFRDNRPVLQMNAVVGRPKHDTPILQSTITTVIINPQWTVPTSIVEKEIRPAIARNHDYLQRNRMYWSPDGQLVQEPGPQNSLGQIKFEFPNNYGVYLHDTPAHALFNDVDRAQSHGCVRLQHPLDLAEELLKDNSDWPREAIEQAIRDGATVRVALEEGMPVTLAYWTVFVDDDGAIEFRPDVYGRDAPLAASLMPQASLPSDRHGA